MLEFPEHKKSLEEFEEDGESREATDVCLLREAELDDCVGGLMKRNGGNVPDLNLSARVAGCAGQTRRASFSGLMRWRGRPG